MFKEVTDSVSWGGSKISLQQGVFCRGAGGSVLASFNKTEVLCVVTVSESETSAEFKGFLALTVNFVCKTFSRGKIPQGFIKREGKPSEREVLASRVIDRCFRPVIGAEFGNEVNINCVLLSSDGSVAPEVPAIMGVSAALRLAGIDIEGKTVVGCQVGYSGAGYIANPQNKECLKSLDMFVGLNKSSVLMVECSSESLSGSVVEEGLFFGVDSSLPIIDFVDGFVDKVGECSKVAPVASNPALDKVRSSVEAHSGSIEDICKSKVADVPGRRKALSAFYDGVCKSCCSGDAGVSPSSVLSMLRSLEKNVTRSIVLDTQTRMDGRDSCKVRDIDVRLGVLNNSHGSSLFTRGNTQALVSTTLGTGQDEQVVDDLEGDRKEHFMLHYNFPPYAVGEVAPLRPPGRREIGHGRLALKALKSVLPDKTDFPYAIRVVSDIMESDGSSSMATVCGASLSMMDCGVPIKQHVAGVAMGLLKEGDKCLVLTDISGDEDYIGDMDFKVAGTASGITALQMDVKKVDGVDRSVISKVLSDARVALDLILEKMNSSISSHNKDFRDGAPCITSYYIDKDKISKVIGSRGKVIKEICEVTGAKVDIEEDGRIYLVGDGKDAVDKARSMIEQIVAEPKIGCVYMGTVVNVTDFGAFVKFFGDAEGLVHISEISEGRVEDINSFVSKDDKVRVVVVGIEKCGNVRLSMKRVDQESGELIGTLPSEGVPRGTRGGGGNSSSYGSRKRSGSSPYGGGGGSSSSYGNRRSNSSRGGSNSRRDDAGGERGGERGGSLGRKRFF